MATAKESEDRSDTVAARVSEELMVRVRVSAGKENMNVSEWVRQTLDEAADDFE